MKNYVAFFSRLFGLMRFIHLRGVFIYSSINVNPFSALCFSLPGLYETFDINHHSPLLLE
jgi:hypothetical protein